jgi:hypothetical protein
MIRDRVYVAIGGTMCILGTLMCVISGAAVVRVLSLFGEPAQGLPNELNMTVLAAAFLAAGLCTVAHALRLAHAARPLLLIAKTGIGAAGVLTAIAAVLMYAAIGGVSSRLGVILEVQDPAARTRQLAALANAGRVQFSAGLFALLSAQVLLGMCLWAVFWSNRLPEEAVSPVATPAAACALVASGGFMLCIAWAARHGLAAWNARVVSATAGQTVAEEVFSLFTYAQFGFALLALIGLMIAILGALFRVDKTPWRTAAFSGSANDGDAGA